ncbi:MAG TPA: hypothetical protein VER76_17365 [Pyrinomonadaceae bacterium]|nr:hypothetical protein [Pyrinomonadaceae bacterium]
MKMSQTALCHFLTKKLTRISALTCAGLLAFSASVLVGAQSDGNSDSPRAVQAQNTITGQWTAEVNRSKPDEIQITYHRRSETGGFSMSGARVALGELQGLTSEAVFSSRANVNFNVLRPAGTFACEGYFREGRGAGFWTFTPSRSFLSEMRARGYNDLTDEDMLRAALHNLTTNFIEDLRSVGYDRLEFKQLMRASSHGVTLAFIREMQSAGYQGLSIEELVRARNHNINGQYVKEVRAMGFDKQPLEKLVRLRNHKITQEFINHMRSAGFDGLSIEELIRLRNHRITPEFVNGLKAEGYPDIPVETAIRLKNHDIDGGYIKRVKARGFNDLTLEQIIRLRNRDIIK